ncbi:ewing's tumor-associated antigen 1 isoform X2 [Dasypus novemcinctus]|uniref:ewing's tumor-associated antigen 1 isoform X2 n=1 Tax=Dasypus novemcinctus TaxID=9361 RepID=UPI00265DF09B|nr:ewing's tumor-associated antigen 1 isoform X2 [Dasypus novemcinctus]
MSRRRKHGDDLGPKDMPRKTAAAEECSSVVGPGRRRLRSARDSGLRGAAEGPPPPMWQQAQPPAAASCSKKRYETPKRVLKMDIFSCTFSSPNDPDGQSDIFWDQNSPMTKQLGKGNRKQIYTPDSDEISHIVNRIAPQDEKPATNSMLGIWIGAAAIPCTPSIAKGKSRAKFSCTKLKTQNREEELMELAKQFDKNMEELDVIEEQNNTNHDFIQINSETETLHNDNVQMQSLSDMVPKIDSAIIKKPVKENTKMPVADDQNSSQKSFDQYAEAAFNAIFDGSTQKCSGLLSQDPSDAYFNTSDTTFGKKSGLKEEKILINETLVTEKLQNEMLGSLSFQVGTPLMAKSYITSCTKELEAFSKHTDPSTTSDFEDDWEKLLDSEPFVMPELLSAPKTTHGAVHKGICAFNSKNDKSKSRTNKTPDAKLRDSKNLQDTPSETHNRGLIDAEKYRFSPDPNKPNKLPSTGNKMKFENALNKIVIQDRIEDGAAVPNITKAKDDIHTKFTPNVNASEKKYAWNTRYANEQKNKPIFNQSLSSDNTDPFGSATAGNETTVSNPNQTNASKLGTFFDDWNDLSFSNEVIKTCHQLENTWETDDVDDDLLYQACDDIERLTQQQDIRKDDKTSGSIFEINSLKHGANNMFTTSKEGNQLVQLKHLNLDSITVQTSSLTNSSQIDKSTKKEKRGSCRNYPGWLGATTNLTMYSKNSNCQINNLPISWNKTDVPIKVNSSKFPLAGNSSLNVSSSHMSAGITNYKKKLSTQHLTHRIIPDEAQSSSNKVKFSKYTFTKVKNSQTLSQFNQSCIVGSLSDTKITQDLGENKMPSVNPLLGEPVRQQSLTKLSESLKQPSEEEEEKNRKYSPEEIQRKRQEALVRRMAKAQASSVNAAPT